MNPETAPFLGPHFLAIGVPKAGSTWLYELLNTHPDVYLPASREVHFFAEENFKRGLGWYRNIFPREANWNKYIAIGEITPSYLYCDDSRIQYIAENLPSTKKFICIVRNPTDRAYSNYFFKQHTGQIKANVSFEDYLQEDHWAISIGFYAKYLKNWLRHYTREQFLILVFEELFQDVEKAKHQIAEFLEIDSDKFPAGAGRSKVNERFTLRYPGIYVFAVKFARKLRKSNLNRFVNWLRVMGIGSAISVRKEAPKNRPMNSETREQLVRTYAAEIRELEEILGRDIESWKMN